MSKGRFCLEDLILLWDISLRRQNGSCSGWRGEVLQRMFGSGLGRRGAAALVGILRLGWEDVKVGKIIGNLGVDKEIGAEKYLGVAGEQ